MDAKSMTLLGYNGWSVLMGLDGLRACNCTDDLEIVC